MSKKQKAQGLIEYILTTALIAIAVVVALTFLGNRLAPVFTKIQVEPTIYVK